MTRLEFGDSLATHLDLAVYDSLVIRQAGPRSDKTRWPNERFMKGQLMLWWAGLFTLQGVKARTCIWFVLEDRPVLILIGLHM